MTKKKLQTISESEYFTVFEGSVGLGSHCQMLVHSSILVASHIKSEFI